MQTIHPHKVLLEAFHRKQSNVGAAMLDVTPTKKVKRQRERKSLLSMEQ